MVKISGEIKTPEETVVKTLKLMKSTNAINNSKNQ